MRGTAALREALGSRELRLLLLARAGGSLALWAFGLTLAIVAYRAGGASAVALAVLARVLPGALAGPYAARLVDGRARRAALDAIARGTAAALVALAVAAAAGAALGVVLVLAAVVSLLAAGRSAGHARLLPAVARDTPRLAAAAALERAGDRVAAVLGALLGALAAAGLAPWAGFALAAAAAAATAAVLARLPAQGASRVTPPARSTVTSELLRGARELLAARELRVPAALLLATGLARGALAVLAVVVAFEHAGLGVRGAGLLAAAWAAGALAGGALAARLLARGRMPAGADAGAALVAAGPALVALSDSPGAALLGFAVLGAGLALAETTARTFLQRVAGRPSPQRAFAVAEAAARIAAVPGALVAPVLVAALGVRGALLAAALVLPVAVIARWGAALSADARTDAPERVLAALRGDALLAAVAPATLQTLARRALPRAVEPGEVILRDGAHGSRLHVIAEGAFRAQAGTVARPLGPGDCFGEIALLHDVEHHASVTATTGGLLYLLGREDFLRAVTGHLRSTPAAWIGADG